MPEVTDQEQNQVGRLVEEYQQLGASLRLLRDRAREFADRLSEAALYLGALAENSQGTPTRGIDLVPEARAVANQIEAARDRREQIAAILDGFGLQPK